MSKKTISTLNGTLRIINLGYRCSSETCDHVETVYRSAEADNMSMKYLTFGMDVLTYIGQLRYKEHKTRGEICEELFNRNIMTSERNVQKLYERYNVLLRASAQEHAKNKLKDVVKEHGGIVLSMDGVQPEKGNETLYVIREVLSGTIISAENVKSSSTEELKALIRPVIEMNLPILGFVSDGQRTIRKAIEELKPEVPYQYCQYHYLKDITKPVEDVDRKLKTGVKKSLRGIRDIERKAAEQESLEAEVVQDYTAALRSILLEDGKPPLDLPGMKVYKRTMAIHQSLEKTLGKKGDSFTETSIQNSRKNKEV
ncbi:MAG TPA: transposase [Solirubrobacterales bacterium]|nr:transposase [Solirubrobacterales bacterium]